MVLFHRACCTLGNVTHRLVHPTTGAFIFSKDHGVTVRAVTPVGDDYAVAGDRAADDKTTRLIDEDGEEIWSADHGATVWAAVESPDGELWTAGTTSGAVTHRRYDPNDGTELQTINATPFGGGVQVDPVSGRIWAFKDTGGTDPVSLSIVFGYDADASHPYSISTFHGDASGVGAGQLMDHDDAGSLYLSDGHTVEKRTAGVLDWSAATSEHISAARCFTLDRGSGESYVAGDGYITKFDASGNEVYTNVSEAIFANWTILHMAAVGDKIYACFSQTGGIQIGALDAATGDWINVGTGVSDQASASFMEPDGSAGFYIGTSAGVLVRYDAWPANPFPPANSPALVSSRDWVKTSIGAVRHLSAGAGHVAVATGNGLRLYTAGGTLLWTKSYTGGAYSVSIHDGAVWAAVGTSTTQVGTIVKLNLTTGAVELARNPTQLTEDISVVADEIAVYSPGTWHAKIYDPDGTLYDVYSGALTAVAFDGAGNLFLGGSARVLKLNADTFVETWRAAFGTVDLGIASNGKVLTATGTTLRQLTSAGASDWSKSLSLGVATSVAYDSADNAWVAHTIASSITHQKFSPTGTALLTGNHTGSLNAIRLDAADQPLIGGNRV